MDCALHAHETTRSRHAVQQWILRGLVTVDGRARKPGFKLRPLQIVRWTVPPPPDIAVAPEPIPLDVVYEDADIVVVNKGAGMVVHPAGPLRSGTLVNALQHRFGARAVPGGPDRPGIVHRLDKGTSGLMVIALSTRAYGRLVAMIARREVSRTYLAIVWGSPSTSAGAIDMPVGRSPHNRKRMAVVEGGKPASTSFLVRRAWRWASEVEVSLRTGRTHQIRVHLSWMGHPVVGDGDYGGRRAAFLPHAPGRSSHVRDLLRLIDRPALHAWRLAFAHPVDARPLSFEVPPPADYAALRQALEAGR